VKLITFKNRGRPTNKQRKALSELSELEKEMVSKEQSGLPPLGLYHRRDELRRKANMREQNTSKKPPSR
jgi:hypothetical protein